MREEANYVHGGGAISHLSSVNQAAAQHAEEDARNEAQRRGESAPPTTGPLRHDIHQGHNVVIDGVNSPRTGKPLKLDYVFQDYDRNGKPIPIEIKASCVRTYGADSTTKRTGLAGSTPYTYLPVKRFDHDAGHTKMAWHKARDAGKTAEFEGSEEDQLAKFRLQDFNEKERDSDHMKLGQHGGEDYVYFNYDAEGRPSHVGASDDPIFMEVIKKSTKGTQNELYESVEDENR